MNNLRKFFRIIGTITLIVFGFKACAFGAFFQPFSDNGELTQVNRASINQCTNNISISYWCTMLASTVGGGRTISRGSQFDNKSTVGVGAGVDFDCDDHAGGSSHNQNLLLLQLQ